MRQLFPEIQPYSIERFRVSELHELYLEQCGNQQGAPVIFLHGGPGAGISEKSRRYFDPTHYRVILFDQRGAGKSTPRAELRENTTWDLVEDIERIREHCGVKRWLVFGGSWGSTLALAYAQRYPERVTGLVLRGVFLGTPWEIDWCCNNGWRYFFPEYWERFVAPIPEAERSDIIAAYNRRLTSADPEVRMAAVRGWAEWELAVLKLIPDTARISEAIANPELSAPITTLECHYFLNKCFFPSPNYLLDNMEKLQKIPGIIVHGRYDLICPYKTSWELHRSWPGSKLVTVPDAGHASDEPGILNALIEATESFKEVG